MSNIDERVVKMDFDNKAFEKNAGDTLSTLDKLKEALKFDKVKDSFKGITKAANKVDVSNIGEGVDTVKAKFSTLQVAGYTAISNITNSLINFGKNVVNKTFGQIISGGINRSLNIEQARFTIEGLGKDFVQLKEDINYAVSGTAYGFDEAAKAASMMAASGIKAGDDMKASLRGISGMAAMTGDSYSNIADIFGNIAGKGKLGLQEVNRFATRGINVAAKLAETWNMTEAEVREAISKGTVSFRDFAMAMDEAFGEHATEANKTFTGIVTNMKATLSRIGESFIHPLIETNAKDALLLQSKAFKEADEGLADLAFQSDKAFEASVNARTALNKAINDSNVLSKYSKDQVKALTEGNEKAFLEASKKIPRYADKSKKELKSIFQEGSALAGVIQDTSNLNSKQIKALIDGNEEAFMKASKNVPQYAKLSQDELKKVYKTSQDEIEFILASTPEYAGKSQEELQAILATSKEQFIAQAKTMEQYAGKSDKELGKLYDKYSGFQYNLVTVFQSFRRIMQAIETNINNSSFLQVFLEKMRGVSKALSLFFNAIAASMTTVTKAGKPFEHALSVVTESGKTRIIKASRLWEKFRKTIGMSKPDFENIRDTFKGLTSIFGIFIDAGKSVFKIIRSSLKIFKPLASIVLLFTGTLGRLVHGIIETIRSFDLFGNVASGISGILDFIIGGITSFVDLLVSIFTKITNNPITKEILNTFIIIGKTINNIFDTLFDTAKNVFTAFTSPLRFLVSTVDFVGINVDKVLRVIADALHFFNTGLESALHWIEQFIDGFVDLGAVYKMGTKFADFFKNLFNFNFDDLLGGNAGKGTDIFGDFMSGLVGSATKEGGGIIKLIGGIALGIGNAIKNIDFKKIAKTIINGFKLIVDTVAFSLGVIVEVFNSIGDVFKSIDYSGIQRSFSNAIEKIIEVLAIVLIGIPSIIGEMLVNLANTISKTNYKKVADKIGVALGNVIAEGIRLILKVLPLIIRILWTALKVVATKIGGIFNEFAYEINDIFGIDVFKIFDSVKKFFTSFKGIFAVIGIANIVAIIAILKAIKSAMSILKGTIGIAGSINKLIGSASSAMQNLSEVFKAIYIKSLIESIVLLSVMAYVLGKMDEIALTRGILFLTIFGLMFAGFVKLMNKVTPLAKNIPAFVSMLSAFQGLLLSLAAVIFIVTMMGKDAEAMWQGILALGSVMLGLFAFVKGFSKMKGLQTDSFARFAAAMIPLSAGIAIMAIAIKLLSGIDPWGAVTAVGAIGSIIAALVFSATLLTGKKQALLALGSLGPMILMISGAIALLGLFDFATVWSSVGAIAAIIAVLVGAAAFVGNFPPLAAGLTALSGAFVLLGTSILMIGGGVFLVVSALQTLAMMGKDGSILYLAVAIQTVASTIPILFEAIGIGIVSLVETIGKYSIKIADALINIIIDILARLVALTDMFVTVGLQIIMKILFGLSTNMYMLTTMAIQCVVQFINGVAANMDAIVQSGVNLVVNFINGMANAIETNGDKIRAAVAHLMGSIIIFVIDSIQSLLEAIPGGSVIAKKLDPAKKVIKDFFGDGKINKENKKGADEMANAIDQGGKKAKKKNKKNTDDIVKDNKKGAKNAGKAWEAFPEGANEAISEFTEGNDFMKDFPKLGKTKMEDFQDSFVGAADPKQGKKAGNKVKDGVEDVSFSGSATNAYDGFKDTFDKKSWRQRGVDAAKKVNRGFNDTLEIESPSRVFARNAEYVYLGFANGMKKFSNKFGETGSKAATNVNDSFKSSINLLSNIDLDSISEPVIRPIMDLTNVKMGANAIGSMFNSRYALGIAGAMPNGNLAASKNITFNNRITVDGTEDPSKWADEFIQELEIQARTL